MDINSLKKKLQSILTSANPWGDTNPQLSGNQNFWTNTANRATVALGQSPVGHAIVNLQKATPAFQQQGQSAFGLGNFINNGRSITDYVPQFQAPQNNIPLQIGAMLGNLPAGIGGSIVGKGIVDPMLDVGSMIGRELTGQALPQYNQVKSAPVRLGMNLTGNNLTPQQILGNLAGIADPIVNAYGGDAASQLAKDSFGLAARRTLPTVLKHELPKAIATGAGFGAIQGLEDNRNQDLGTQLKNTAISTAGGALAGGLLGGGLATGGYLAGAGKNQVVKVLQKTYNFSEKEANQVVEQFQRDEKGRFMKFVKGKDSPALPGLSNNMLGDKFAKEPVNTEMLPGKNPLYSPARGKLYSRKNVSQEDVYKTIRDTLHIPEKIDVPTPGLSVKMVDSKNLNKDIRPQAMPGDFSNSRSADQLFAKKNLDRQPGNPEPVPWEANNVERASTIPTAQQPQEGVQLGAEGQNSQQLNTATPGQQFASNDKITQSLQGDNHQFNQDLGAGVPKKPTPNNPMVMNPNGTVKDALSKRYAITESIAQRERVLKTIQSQGIASGEHNLYRDAIEHPEDLPKILQKVKNPEAFTKAVNAHRDFTEYLYQTNIDNGGTLRHVNNYATHIYDLSDPLKAKEYEQLLAQGRAKNYTGYFNQSRVFPDLRTAKAAGFLPKNANVQQDIEALSSAAQKEIGGRVLANELKRTFPGQIVTLDHGEAPPPNAIQLTIPGMKGTYVTPKLYDQLKFLQPQDLGSIGKAADFVSGGIKHLELSGGLFHVKNTGLDYLGAQLSYGHMPRVDEAAHAFFSEDFTNKMRQSFIDSGKMEKMLKSNITLSKAQDFPSNDNIISGVRGAISKVNPLSMLNRATFSRLEDYFKMSLFDTLDKKGLIDFSTPEKARQSQAIGAQINDIFGGQNRAVGDSVIKSKFGQWIARQGVLAPDYQEGRFKRTLSAINPNITGKPIGKLQPRSAANNVALRTLAGRMIVTAVLAEVARRVVSGHFSPDIKSALQNDIIDPSYPSPFKNKDKHGNDIGQLSHMPASNVSDALKLAQDPEHFAISHLGAGLSTGLSYASNQDYFGNKLSDTNNPIEKLSAIAESKMPIPVVQAEKVASGKENIGNALINVAGDRVTRDPNDPTVKGQTAYFNALNQTMTKLTPKDQALFNAIPASDPNDPAAKRDKYVILHDNPQIFEAKKQIALAQANGDMSKVDPIYLTPSDQIVHYLNYEAQNPGSQDAKDLLKAHPEILQIMQARSQYFTNNPISGGQQDNPSPQASSYVQQQMDLKNWKDPQVQAYLNAKNDYTNQLRAQLGLTPLAGFTPYPKKPKKVTFKAQKIKLAKSMIKAFKPKKIKPLKIAKAKKVKSLSFKPIRLNS